MKERMIMNQIVKRIATTISMIVAVVSLAAVSPTASMGKGNRPTGNPARAQQATNSQRRTVTMLDYEGQTVVAPTGNANSRTGNLARSRQSSTVTMLDYDGSPRRRR